MAKKYAVLHLDKLNVGGGLGAHIDRKHTPENADPERRHLNQELIQSATESLKKDIDRRISEGYKSTRKIRTDAVKAVGVILSGSPEQMKEIEKAGQLQEWIQDNLEFVQERFGKDNIMRFTVHMDEKTPHIHCVFTPISPDGRLHYKSFIASKKDLRAVQDTYASRMEKFGLKRGLKQSRVHHTTTREFYASINDVKIPEMKKNILGVPKPGEAERLLDENRNMHQLLINGLNDQKKLVSKGNKLLKDYKELARENAVLKDTIKEKDEYLLKSAVAFREILKNPLRAVQIVLEGAAKEVMKLFYSDSNLRDWVNEGNRKSNQDRGLKL